MRKPGPVAYLFGNPVTVIGAVSATGFFGYQWWSNDGSLLPAIIAFLVMCQSMNSTAQLQKYNEWKREWEAMEGKSAGASGIRFAWTPAMRFVVGILAWGIGAYWMLTVPMGDDLPIKLAKVSLWLGSALGAVVLIYRAFRLLRKPQTNQVVKSPDPIVCVCLALPRSSPAVAETYSTLPEYCIDILQ